MSTITNSEKVYSPTKESLLNFRKVNNVTGWAVFLIALIVYTLTVEPTASFWDCGEFIAASYKLMVPHPPGAPFFLLVNRIFSLLAGDVGKVAFWVNMSSVLCSAGTILFLFWTITLLARRILNIRTNQVSTWQAISLMGAGAIGALAYTFSDSFWFSAVEAEVYAMSSFFTAFVFWAIFKWELIEDESAANRWLILIAYMVGLSIGVHLLNLVALPALGLVYYFKKYKPSTSGVIAALVISGGIILAIMIGIIPGLPSIAGSMEILFVNSFGLPFGSGITLFVILLLGALVYGLIYSIRQQKALLNTALLALTFILIGYGSYAMVLIRSNYNPPINENDPSDIINFVTYLKREQYGDRPLLVGHDFTTSPVGYEKTSPVYIKGKDKYEIIDYKQKPIYDDNARVMLFPRIFSRQDNHVQLYQEKLGLKNGERPTMGDNLQFLFTHQLGHMYFRYFLWNFMGRQSDIEGAGVLTPWDGLKKEKELSWDLASNWGRNNFFMLPFILGLAGFLFQYSRDRKGFWTVLLLFFLTGAALVLYLNSPPVEPRERDYIYVGSYYAYAMWIGLGVLALAEGLRRFIKNQTAAAATSTALCLLVPGVMAAQGWDDHDRSNRYHSVDSAKNLLNACAPNAILFTGGDNDTFPLWYVQEVEGFRTDVRVCNLSLLGTDWYISQMKRKVYQSDALPISFERQDYIAGTNDQIPVLEQDAYKGGLRLDNYIKAVKTRNPRVRQTFGDQTYTILPSRTLVLPVNKEKVLQSGLIKPELRDSVQENMIWNINRGDLLKPDLMILDMIVTNNWERPIYFSSTLAPSSYLNLKEFMQVEGMVYRLLPVRVAGATQGYVNTDVMYENMTNKTFWREMDNPKVYYDENYRRFPVNARINFARLAEQLLQEGKQDKARQAALYCLKVLPDAGVPYDEGSSMLVGPLLQTGETKKAVEIANVMSERADQNLDYYISKEPWNAREIQTNLYVMNQLVEAMKASGQPETAKYEKIFEKHYNNYASLYARGGMGGQ